MSLRTLHENGTANESHESLVTTPRKEPNYPEQPGDYAGDETPASLRLQVRFFGGFEIYCGGGRVPMGSNSKALTILKYLLAHKNSPVSQDYLMDWLWPDSSPKKARWSLNSAVYALRRLCSRWGSHEESFECVSLKAGYYRLSPAIQVVSDVEEFDAYYESGRLLQRTRQTREAAEEYERAIWLYRGDYLAEDLYEDWTMIERERLSNAYIDMLDRLASHYMETGQFRKSIHYCYKLLEKDPCHENSYRLLMRSYTHLGLKARALKQYRLCEQMLRRRYGMSPSPETQILHRSLLEETDI